MNQAGRRFQLNASTTQQPQPVRQATQLTGVPRKFCSATNSTMAHGARQYNNTKVVKVVILQKPLTRVPRKFCSAMNSIMRPASATPRLPHRSLSLVSRSCWGDEQQRLPVRPALGLILVECERAQRGCLQVAFLGFKVLCMPVRLLVGAMHAGKAADHSAGDCALHMPRLLSSQAAQPRQFQGVQRTH